MVILSEKGAYMESKFWLMKSEPTDYSFDDLKSETDSTAEWDGVRNYQARNLLRDNIKSGDNQRKRNKASISKTYGMANKRLTKR